MPLLQLTSQYWFRIITSLLFTFGFTLCVCAFCGFDRYRMLWLYQYIIMQKHHTSLKGPCAPNVDLLTPCHKILKTTDHLSYNLQKLAFFSMSYGISQYVAVPDWVLLCTNINSYFPHVLMTWWLVYICHWILVACHSLLFTQLLKDILAAPGFNDYEYSC